MIEAAWCRFFATYPRAFCVHTDFFLPFIGMTVLIPSLPVVIRYVADYG